MTGHGDDRPSDWVARFAARIPPDGLVLDLACGRGRHVRYLRRLGHPVVAVDREVASVHSLADPRVEIVQADLEHAPWPLGARTFAGVVVTNYLWRPLLPRIVATVASGGVLLYETYAVGHERFGHPRNPDFLLRSGELLDAVRGRLEVIAYEHGPVGEPPVMVRQRICAVHAG
jgi:SAM-dependent methyltransferase